MQNIVPFRIFFSLILIILVFLFFFLVSKTNIGNKNVIPLYIYQTWHTKKLPPFMAKCVHSIQQSNPEFQHTLFDDEDCRKFLAEHFEPDVLYAYDMLIPGAFKADLWRYCILYKRGGIYLDIKYKCINGFKFIHVVDKEHFVNDRERVLQQPAIYNALMICKPNNKILLQCINQIISNVNTKFYGTNALQVTGPLLMIPFFTKEDRKKIDMYHNDEMNDTLFFIYYKHNKILTIYQQYRQEQSKHQSLDHYSVLWNNKQIYY